MVESGDSQYAEQELRRERFVHLVRSTFLLGTVFGLLCFVVLCFLVLFVGCSREVSDRLDPTHAARETM